MIRVMSVNFVARRKDGDWCWHCLQGEVLVMSGTIVSRRNRRMTISLGIVATGKKKKWVMSQL